MASVPGMLQVEDPQNTSRCLRDVLALSTLPAVWSGAAPVRIAESLAAALYSMLEAEFVYVSLHADLHSTAVAQVDRFHTSAEVASRVGPAILAWSREHDPDEPLHLPNPQGPGTLRVCAWPVGAHAEFGVIGVAVAAGCAPMATQQLFLSVAAAHAAIAVQNLHLLQSLRQNILEKEESQSREREARKEAELLYEVAQTIAAELDLQAVVQKVTDAATELTGARFGAFFYNVKDDKGESYLLYTLSGAPREAFAKFGLPRNTAMFEPTFRGQGPVRIADVRADARYGKNSPHHGIPKGHLPVRSYLAVPVVSRSGEVMGGLFFGHPEVGIFTEHAERIAVGIAAQAAVAMDNAQLFQRAQAELAERKEVENGLRRSEHRFRSLLSVVTDVPWVTNPNGEFITPQAEWEAYTGQAWEQHRGFGWLEAIHPDDHDALMANWRRAVEQGGVYDSSGRLWHAPTQRWRRFRAKATPVRSPDGSVIEWVGTCTDVEDQKRTEEVLARAEKSVATGQMAAVIAHEVNNPMQALTNLLSLMNYTCPDDHTRSLAAKAQEELHRMARITKQMLAFHRDTAFPVPVNLIEVLEDAAEFWTAKASNSQVRLVREYESVPEVRGFPGELRQLFANLLGNAIQATPPGGKVRLRVMPSIDWKHPSRRGVRVSIVDTGCGIDAGIRTRIFEPFFTTKGQKGSGLGLWVVHGVVTRHQGTLRLRTSTAEGKSGTWFSVFLPASPGSGDPAPGATGQPRP